MALYPKLPTQFSLPFKFRIDVKLISEKRFKKLGLWPAYAAWYQDQTDSGVIYILETLPYHEKLSKFAHEMRHAMNDWEHYIMDSIKEPFLREVVHQMVEEDED